MNQKAFNSLLKGKKAKWKPILSYLCKRRSMMSFRRVHPLFFWNAYRGLIINIIWDLTKNRGIKRYFYPKIAFDQ